MGIVRGKDSTLPRVFDQHGFSGGVISAPNKEIATRALHHADWSDEWAEPIEVDRKARPLGLPWSKPCVTDAGAIADAQSDVRRELEVQRKLRLVAAEMRSEMACGEDSLPYLNVGKRARVGPGCSYLAIGADAGPVTGT